MLGLANPGSLCFCYSYSPISDVKSKLVQICLCPTQSYMLELAVYAGKQAWRCGMVPNSDASDQGQRQTLRELLHQGREQMCDFRTRMIYAYLSMVYAVKASIIFPCWLTFVPL